MTRIIFMGSPKFAVPILKELEKKHHIVGVVTQPDRPAGRNRKLVPPPVKLTALELGLPVIQPNRLSEENVLTTIGNWKPDMIIVAAYGQILKKNILELPTYGCINVHASLLPRWRGAAPIQAAILHGDTKTGVTIMKMDPGLDTGPIYSQKEIPINPDDNSLTLSEKLSHLGAELLIETIPQIVDHSITPYEQDSSQATYAPKLSKKDAELDFTKSSQHLFNHVRAFFDRPGAYMLWNNHYLKVLKVSICDKTNKQYENHKPGTRIIINSKPAVVTIDGCIILEEVKPAGKKSMLGEAFLRGARDWRSE